MKPAYVLTVVAIALGVAACADNPDPSIKTTLPVTRSAPPAPALTDATPAPTPSTHAGAPATEAPATATAKDTPGNNPQGNLTSAEENTAMPKAGQANNHSSPAFDPARAEPKS